MATITGLTAAAMEAIRDNVIVDGEVVGNNLILTKQDGSTVDAGNVRGPAGATGTNGTNGSTDRFIGELIPLAGTTVPPKCLAADGSAVSRTTYAALFAEIGTTYGAGNGTTTFNLPNTKGRTLVTKDSGQTEFDELGETGGAKTHTLSSGEMPSHSHGVTDPGHGHGTNSQRNFNGQNGTAIAYWDSLGGGSENGTKSATTGISIQNSGSGNAHNNLQPYLTVNMAIYTGVQ